MTVQPTRQGDTYRVAGCDLGKAAAKFVVGRVDADGRLEIDEMELVDHDGRPMEAFRNWYHRADVTSCAALPQGPSSQRPPTPLV